MTITSYLLVALLSVLGIATLVEFYKKTIRKGNAKNWENWIVGAVLSVGFAILDCLKGLAYPFVSNQIINILIYAAVFFVVQLFVDMKLIKKLISSAIASMDLEKFVLIVLDKLGISLDKVKDVLKKLGITREKLKNALVDAGFPEDKVEKLLDMLFN